MQVRFDQSSSKPCESVTGDGCGYVIFGASGDLTQRKLLPSVFSLCRTKKVAAEFFVIGYARSPMDDATFRIMVREAIRQAYDGVPEGEIETFTRRCFYVSGGYDHDDGYQKLRAKTEELAAALATGGNLVFHIATPPEPYADIVAGLGKNGLIKKHQNEAPFQRVIVEKPFGRDLESADLLNNALLEHLSDEQIYRIDHYLGKETVQNILMFRFANPIFEPAWNSAHIDHVQITVAESLGVEHRAGYFEQSGLLRDMFQNHMLQLAALVGMEPPISFDSENIQDEKVKFMKSIRPFDLEDLDAQLVRGQYGPGVLAGHEAKAYREEAGVSSSSGTETYFAMKLMVDNWRWHGVPFYLRAGKRLPKKLTQIAVVFKKAPHGMFSHNQGGVAEPSPNVLIFDIQPRQGLSLSFQAKVPGAKMCLAPVKMEFNYRDVYGPEMDEDYSTLILDCIRGDQTLYWRKDGVQASWKLLTPVLQNYEGTINGRSETQDRLETYPADSWGPAAGARLLAKDGRQWLAP